MKTDKEKPHTSRGPSRLSLALRLGVCFFYFLVNVLVVILMAITKVITLILAPVVWLCLWLEVSNRKLYNVILKRRLNYLEELEGELGIHGLESDNQTTTHSENQHTGKADERQRD